MRPSLRINYNPAVLLLMQSTHYLVIALTFFFITVFVIFPWSVFEFDKLYKSLTSYISFKKIIIPISFKATHGIGSNDGDKYIGPGVYPFQQQHEKVLAAELDLQLSVLANTLDTNQGYRVTLYVDAYCHASDSLFEQHTVKSSFPVWFSNEGLEIGYTLVEKSETSQATYHYHKKNSPHDDDFAKKKQEDKLAMVLQNTEHLVLLDCDSRKYENPYIPPILKQWIPPFIYNFGLTKKISTAQINSIPLISLVLETSVILTEQFLFRPRLGNHPGFASDTHSVTGTNTPTRSQVFRVEILPSGGGGSGSGSSDLVKLNDFTSRLVFEKYYLPAWWITLLDSTPWPLRWVITDLVTNKAVVYFFGSACLFIINWIVFVIFTVGGYLYLDGILATADKRLDSIVEM